MKIDFQLQEYLEKTVQVLYKTLRVLFLSEGSEVITANDIFCVVTQEYLCTNDFLVVTDNLGYVHFGVPVIVDLDETGNCSLIDFKHQNVNKINPPLKYLDSWIKLSQLGTYKMAFFGVLLQNMIKNQNNIPCQEERIQKIINMLIISQTLEQFLTKPLEDKQENLVFVLIRQEEVKKAKNLTVILLLKIGYSRKQLSLFIRQSKQKDDQNEQSLVLHQSRKRGGRLQEKFDENMTFLQDGGLKFVEKVNWLLQQRKFINLSESSIPNRKNPFDKFFTTNCQTTILLDVMSWINPGLERMNFLYSSLTSSMNEQEKKFVEDQIEEIKDSASKKIDQIVEYFSSSEFQLIALLRKNKFMTSRQVYRMPQLEEIQTQIQNNGSFQGVETSKIMFHKCFSWYNSELKKKVLDFIYLQLRIKRTNGKQVRKKISQLKTKIEKVELKYLLPKLRDTLNTINDHKSSSYLDQFDEMLQKSTLIDLKNELYQELTQLLGVKKLINQADKKLKMLWASLEQSLGDKTCPPSNLKKLSKRRENLEAEPTVQWIDIKSFVRKMVRKIQSKIETVFLDEKSKMDKLIQDRNINMVASDDKSFLKSVNLPEVQEIIKIQERLQIVPIFEEEQQPIEIANPPSESQEKHEIAVEQSIQMKKDDHFKMLDLLSRNVENLQEGKTFALDLGNWLKDDFEQIAILFMKNNKEYKQITKIVNTLITDIVSMVKSLQQQNLNIRIVFPGRSTKFKQNWKWNRLERRYLRLKQKQSGGKRWKQQFSRLSDYVIELIKETVVDGMGIKEIMFAPYEISTQVAWLYRNRKIDGVIVKGKDNIEDYLILNVPVAEQQPKGWKIIDYNSCSSAQTDRNPSTFSVFQKNMGVTTFSRQNQTLEEKKAIFGAFLKLYQQNYLPPMTLEQFLGKFSVDLTQDENQILDSLNENLKELGYKMPTNLFKQAVKIKTSYLYGCCSNQQNQVVYLRPCSTFLQQVTKMGRKQLTDIIGTRGLWFSKDIMLGKESVGEKYPDVYSSLVYRPYGHPIIGQPLESNQTIKKTFQNIYQRIDTWVELCQDSTKLQKSTYFIKNRVKIQLQIEEEEKSLRNKHLQFVVAPRTNVPKDNCWVDFMEKYRQSQHQSQSKKHPFSLSTFMSRFAIKSKISNSNRIGVDGSNVLDQVFKKHLQEKLLEWSIPIVQNLGKKRRSRKSQTLVLDNVKGYQKKIIDLFLEEVGKLKDRASVLVVFDGQKAFRKKEKRNFYWNKSQSEEQTMVKINKKEQKQKDPFLQIYKSKYYWDLYYNIRTQITSLLRNMHNVQVLFAPYEAKTWLAKLFLEKYQPTNQGLITQVYSQDLFFVSFGVSQIIQIDSQQEGSCQLINFQLPRTSEYLAKCQSQLLRDWFQSTKNLFDQQALFRRVFFGVLCGSSMIEDFKTLKKWEILAILMRCHKSADFWHILQTQFPEKYIPRGYIEEVQQVYFIYQFQVCYRLKTHRMQNLRFEPIYQLRLSRELLGDQGNYGKYDATKILEETFLQPSGFKTQIKLGEQFKADQCVKEYFWKNQKLDWILVKQARYKLKKGQKKETTLGKLNIWQVQDCIEEARLSQLKKICIDVDSLIYKDLSQIKRLTSTLKEDKNPTQKKDQGFNNMKYNDESESSQSEEQAEETWKRHLQQFQGVEQSKTIKKIQSIQRDIEFLMKEQLIILSKTGIKCTGFFSSKRLDKNVKGLGCQQKDRRRQKKNVQNKSSLVHNQPLKGGVSEKLEKSIEEDGQIQQKQFSKRKMAKLMGRAAQKGYYWHKYNQIMSNLKNEFQKHNFPIHKAKKRPKNQLVVLMKEQKIDAAFSCQYQICRQGIAVITAIFNEEQCAIIKPERLKSVMGQENRQKPPPKRDREDGPGRKKEEKEQKKQEKKQEEQKQSQNKLMGKNKQQQSEIEGIEGDSIVVLDINSLISQSVHTLKKEIYQNEPNYSEINQLSNRVILTFLGVINPLQNFRYRYRAIFQGLPLPITLRRLQKRYSNVFDFKKRDRLFVEILVYVEELIIEILKMLNIKITFAPYLSNSQVAKWHRDGKIQYVVTIQQNIEDYLVLGVPVIQFINNEFRKISLQIFHKELYHGPIQLKLYKGLMQQSLDNKIRRSIYQSFRNIILQKADRDNLQNTIAKIIIEIKTQTQEIRKNLEECTCLTELLNRIYRIYS